MKKLIALTIVAVVSSCAINTVAAKNCRYYGYTPSDADWAQCISVESTKPANVQY